MRVYAHSEIALIGDRAPTDRPLIGMAGSITEAPGGNSVQTPRITAPAAEPLRLPAFPEPWPSRAKTPRSPALMHRRLQASPLARTNRQVELSLPPPCVRVRPSLLRTSAHARILRAASHQQTMTAAAVQLCLCSPRSRRAFSPWSMPQSRPGTMTPNTASLWQKKSVECSEHVRRCTLPSCTSGEVLSCFNNPRP